MGHLKIGSRVLSIFWVCFGIAISVWSVTFPFGVLEEPGPAYFPLGCGVILVLLGSIMFIGSKASKIRTADNSLHEYSGAFLPNKAARKRVLLTVAGILLSVIVFEPLGFVLTVFFLILFLVCVVQPQGWKMALFYAFVSSLTFYILFKVVLKTQLPSGVIGVIMGLFWS